MALASGFRLGPYEIVDLIGAGGMGQVYRARDTTLGRDVAIKALPDSLAGDPERVARFQREAQVLAALSHPNIGGIHGWQEAAGAKYLVLEFVQGVTLADHLTVLGAGLAMPDALPIARQIIDALEAAHDKGIVHRDLKPANIMLTPEGQVKVLDFGLARVVDADPAASAANSPTLTLAATQMGVILGTAAYMSPEQAKGRTADKRSDVWAFGCVLFEMLTGRRVFQGEDVSDTLAAVLRADPDWAALPATTPPGVRVLLQRCLDRDRKTRIPDMAVVRFLLNDALAAPPVLPAPGATAPSARPQLSWLAAALAAGVVVTAGVGWAVLSARPGPAPLQVVRFSMAPPAGQALAPTISDRQLAVSPDGKFVAYVSGGFTAGGSLVLRPIDRLDAVVLTGITNSRSPFFSHDGKWIGYFQGGGDLRKVSTTGGPSLSISPTDGASRGASWGPENTIVFATGSPSSGLQSVSAGGGVPKVLTTPKAAEGEVDHVLPSFLPDGRGVLFTITPSGGQISAAQIAVLDLATGTYKTLIRGGTHAEYVEPGYLVYASAGSLRAVRFDLVRREVQGDPVPVIEDVAVVVSGAAQFAVSQSGTLAYVPGAVLSTVGGGANRALVWVNRQGKEEAIKAPPRAYFNLRLSPDGTRLALDIRDQDNDIWVLDLARPNLMRLTFDPAAEMFPVWTRDSRRVVFGSARSGAVNVYSQAADGTGAVDKVSDAAYAQYPSAVAADGQLLINELKPGQSPDISLLRMDEKRQVAPLLQSPAVERVADVSADGRWLVYESDESSKSEIYVRPFPDTNSGKWQASIAGGSKPLWAPSGREIFYIDSSGFLMAVPVQTTPTFKAGNPVKLFEARNISTLASARFYDVSRDGQRFVMIKELPPPPGAQPVSAGPTFVVVVNWPEELKATIVK